MMNTSARIVNSAIVIICTLNVHHSMEVGQVIDQPCGSDHDAVTSIQAEEVDPRKPIHGHISAHIQFRKL